MISQKNDLNKMAETLYRAEDKVRMNVMNVVSEVVEDPKHGASALIQGVIMSTPSSLKPGKTNRYLTGNMHNDAEGITLFNNQGLPTIVFGWLDPNIDYEDDDGGENYFFLQELGGRHALTGDLIKPMDSLGKVSRDYLAMKGVAKTKGWASGTTPRLMPLVLEAIKAGLRGERIHGDKLHI